MRARAFWIAIFLAFLLGVGPPTVQAATNRALGGIGGINNGTLNGGDGIGTSEFTIFSAQLALIKQARDLSGNILATNADVNSGSEIWFVLYVDNPTDGPAFDVALIDQLNESQFTYISGSLETKNLALGTPDATFWSDPWTLLSEDTDADIGSIIDTAPFDGNRDQVTIGTEASQPNGSLNIPDGTRQAIRFRVRVN